VSKQRARFVVATAALAAAAGAFAAGAANRVVILSEPDLGEAWAPGPEVGRYVAGYPEAASDKSLDTCVTLGYVIGADGVTSDFVELKSWSSATPNAVPDSKVIKSYVVTAAAVVAHWRYLPVGNKPRPAFTSTTFVFEGQPAQATSSAALRERCSIGDLAAFIAQVRNAAWLKHNRRGNDRIRKPHDMYDRHPNQRLDD